MQLIRAEDFIGVTTLDALKRAREYDNRRNLQLQVKSVDRDRPLKCGGHHPKESGDILRQQSHRVNRGYPMAIASTQHQLSALDQHVAPGLRLWMLIALVLGVLLIMVVLVCCFMRIRIPRTKRQIDLIAAKRKMRNKKAKAVADERSQAIVMSSMRPKPSTVSKPSLTPQRPPIESETHHHQQQQPLIVHTGSRQHTEV
ncbi:hypothetical protein KIN20_026373 [Parelaphostrongylus tenuis]|uniref:Uncharacterized protein n=1 Tax=Parelaphostrongylus tenuis TaxID=148309 RepID=A0AAD5WD03_PARTN|nr:hypothetical protein KIN20_026373 [Parelaphostrongylus tenuis]